MTKLIWDYKKPIMVVETAHAWRKSVHGFIDEQQEKIAGFPATPVGQKQVLDLVANVVASMPDEMGQGLYYWEPICVPKDGEGGWSENMGLLDEPSWMVFFLSYLHGMMPARKNRPRFTSRSQ